VHTAVSAIFGEATGIKRRLIEWALRVGRRVSTLRQQGRRLPPGLAAQHRVADKLVYSKVKERLGGRLRAAISGGAPLAKELSALANLLDTAWVMRAVAGFDELHAGARRNLNRQLGLDALAASLVTTPGRHPVSHL